MSNALLILQGATHGIWASCAAKNGRVKNQVWQRMGSLPAVPKLSRTIRVCNFQMCILKFAGVCPVVIVIQRCETAEAN